MKIPAIQKIRIPILFALVGSEVASILILRGQYRIRMLLSVSVGLILLILPFLWIKEIWRRNISIFLFVLPAITLSLFIAELFSGRGLSDAPASTLFATFVILGSICRRRHPSASPEEQCRVRKAEDIRFLWVCANMIGIVSCFVYLAYHPDVQWANLPLFIAFLFLCATVYLLFIRQTHIGISADSGGEKVGSGGRA
jgi:hypothetical protein